MVKFSRELEAQLIPEWKEAFVNYKLLKKQLKKIKLAISEDHGNDDLIPLTSDVMSPACDTPTTFGITVLDPVRSFYRRKSSHHTCKENYQRELLRPGGKEVKIFMDQLDIELVKVEKFYTSKETEFRERAEALMRQLKILSDVKNILENYSNDQESRSPARPSSSSSQCDYLCHENTVEGYSNNNTQIKEAIITALEKNGVDIIGAPIDPIKNKKANKINGALKIDIPLTPSGTLLAVTATIWEDLINGGAKNTNGNGGGSCITGKKIQCAEKMIRAAYVELYRAIGLLKTYSSLNMLAFKKIMKKFVKVSHQEDTSASFLKKVRSHAFITSSQVARLGDEVETKFIEQFAGNDRKKGMKFLRPLAPKESHVITFFVGLFTGSFVTLFMVYAILAHLIGIFSSNKSDYVESFYPVFSIYALLSLHIFLYGCNLFMWRKTRINHNFIFEFDPNTALKPRDAYLISATMMTCVVGAMVVHLVLHSTSISAIHAHTLPGILSLVIIVVIICPFNVFYHSTRFRLLRVLCNIAWSPFCKVVLVDFFMADQLCSQIPLLRHIEFTACYFVSYLFENHSYDACTNSGHYKFFFYIISFIPYYWRAMQCLRRYLEEGYDMNQMANMGKYVSAMVAAYVRMAYMMNPSNMWILALVIITSTFATSYQLYWDFVKDWGFFDFKSKNFLLDELVLKNKFIYYISMGINLVLRLAWVESVYHINVGPIDHRLLDFFLASLEVVRRCHWNFYRLENEHLNNVGKFRAIKTIPLPFQELDSD